MDAVQQRNYGKKQVPRKREKKNWNKSTSYEMNADK